MRFIDADALKKHYAWWKGGTRVMTMDEAKCDFDTIIDLQPTVEAVHNGVAIFRNEYEIEAEPTPEAAEIINDGTYDAGQEDYDG